MNDTNLALLVHTSVYEFWCCGCLWKGVAGALMCSVTGEVEVALWVGVTKRNKKSRAKPYSRRAHVDGAIKFQLHLVGVAVLG